MFKLAHSDHFWWNVTVSLPAESGNRYESHKFAVKFARLSQQRLTAIQSEITKGKFTDREFAVEIMADWKEVTGADGQELPFNETNRDMVLDVPLVQAAIINAYTDALRNASRKN